MSSPDSLFPRRRIGSHAPGHLGWRGRAALVAAAVAVAVAAAALLASSSALAESQVGGYRLIVHPANATLEVDRGFVVQAFLKKISRWPSGEAIEPIDLDQRSPVRRRWSNEVLNRTIEAVKTYWQQMIFSGRSLPPPEVTTDEQVIDFVLHRPGAIGYVSTGANLRGTHVLSVRLE